MPRQRSGSQYGAAGESAAWKVVYDHYYWDRLSEAYRAASELGAGHWGHGLVGYRMIEGEWITREKGTIERVSEWLSLEWIPDELSDEPPMSQQEAIVDACNQVAWRLGFEHGPPVLVSVLSREADVPWMPGRYGYCTDKFPYDKICIPASSLSDHYDLEHVMMHEYAHVVSLNLSEGRCPMWLDEAVAMVAGGGVDRRAWQRLADGREPWLGHEDLDGAYYLNREDSREHRLVWLAYQQSAVIGYFLSSLKGERGLGDLMRAFANNSTLKDILLRFREDGATDEALKEVYGFGTRELFQRAHDWLVEQKG